eukprot:gene10853-11007_t
MAAVRVILTSQIELLQAPQAALPGSASFGRSGPGYASFASPSSVPITPATPSVKVNNAAGDDAAAAPGPAPSKKAGKPRLPGLDSLRFFLIAYIATGHFIAFATRDAFILKFFSQINVWVGAFFVISGYVVGYTATELNKYEASSRIRDVVAYIVGRVSTFYPLYLLVQVLAGAIFVYADYTYNGPLATIAHGLMSLTLIQAWFPAHAEIWNAPTWFLSALTFAMVMLPFTVPTIASLKRKGLRVVLVCLTLLSLLPKLAYSYDLNAWTLMEGMLNAKTHPNILFWNITRFNPFYCLIEVLMGVAACRLVMIDGVDDDGKPSSSTPAAGSVLLPALGLLAITLARTAGWLTLNDPLTRCLLFVPLFTVLLVNLHRNTLAGPKGFTALLSQPLLVYLGTLSFPIFILHGALGQLFYKKIIATKVWGKVMGLDFFPAYMAVVLLTSAVATKFFLENKKVQEVSANVSKGITKFLTG